MDYTCDLTWDILLLFFWALMLAAVAGGLAFYSKLVDFMNGKNQVLQVDFYLTSTTKMSKGAEMFVDNGKIILIVAVVLAAIMVVSLIITAALSAANRSTLRGEDMQVVLPVHQAPKQVVMMVGDTVPVNDGHVRVQSVAAKPIAYYTRHSVCAEHPADVQVFWRVSVLWLLACWDLSLARRFIVPP
jgi:hypothetical protein